MKKSLFLAAVLSLSTLAFAGPKKYEISLSKPTKAGAVELAPGSYKVQVEGDKAVFTDQKNKSVTVPVKLQTGAAKYQSTAVESSTKGGVDQIDAIDLGGTNSKIEF